LYLWNLRTIWVSALGFQNFLLLASQCLKHVRFRVSDNVIFLGFSLYHFCRCHPTLSESKCYPSFGRYPPLHPPLSLLRWWFLNCITSDFYCPFCACVYCWRTYMIKVSLSFIETYSSWNVHGLNISYLTFENFLLHGSVLKVGLHLQELNGHSSPTKNRTWPCRSWRLKNSSWNLLVDWIFYISEISVSRATSSNCNSRLYRAGSWIWIPYCLSVRTTPMKARRRSSSLLLYGGSKVYTVHM